MFPLEIFPYASLSSSVITTVWIGVIVIAMFNLRLGWVLTGLVVPGYLVPLVIVKPMSAGLIVVESIITYFVVLFLSESLSSLSRWSSIFGRDRFYALVVSSVLVRLLFDVVLVPWVGDWVILNTDYEFDYRNELQSFGLIIVALMANQYWKTGIVRGLFVLAVTGGITLVIVRYGLMEYTNFSIGNLRFMYEDLAASLLSSPKAYIILLTTAYICSRLNLRYGWDFNGILLPSLLALQWFAPYKILTSFVEAFVILVVARQLLRLPWLARMNMEGARLLLLFFNVSFFYKMLLGFTLPLFWPELKITDTYGFGYLLATLLALKMHQKDIIARVSRVTLQASFVSIVVASLIGFGLTLLSKHYDYSVARQVMLVDAKGVRTEQSLRRFFSHTKVELYGARALSRIVKPSASDVDAFQSALRQLRSYRYGKPIQTLELPSRLLASMGYELTVVKDRYLVLHDAQAQRGWGLYIIDTAVGESVNLQVPHAVDDRWLIDVSRELLHKLHGRSLAISSSPKRANNDGSSDMQIESGTLFQVFHTTFARDSVVQVVVAKDNLPGNASASTQLSDKNLIRITDQIPPALDFSVLRSAIGSFAVKWNQRHDDNIHKKTARGGFAELILSTDARRTLVLQSELTNQDLTSLVQDSDYRRLVAREQARYSAGPAKAVAPMHMEDMLYFDELILTPLLALSRKSANAANDEKAQPWHLQPAVNDELRLIRRSATAMDLQLSVIQPSNSTSSYFVVLHDNRADQRRWGLVVIRIGATTEFIVHASQTTVEYGTLDHAMELFDGVQALALTVSPGASRLLQTADHSPTPLATLAGQVLMRESGDAPLLVVTPRAYATAGKVELPTTDALIGVASGEVRPTFLDTPQLNRIVQVLKNQGLSVGFVDGSTATSGYQPSWFPQAAYLDAAKNKELAAIWLSPRSRQDFKLSSGPSAIEKAFAALGLPTHAMSLERRLEQNIADRAGMGNDRGALVSALRRFQANHDIVALRAMVLRWPNVSFEHIKDTYTQQDYLVVARNAGSTVAVARLDDTATGDLEVARDWSASTVITTISHPDTSIIISGED